MKQSILIFSQAMELGGVERSLLGLLDSIDYDRYDVDLFLMWHSGELMPYLNPNAKLLPEIPQYASLAVPMTPLLKSGQFGVLSGRLKGKLAARSFDKRHPSDKPSVTALTYSHKYTLHSMPVDAIERILEEWQKVKDSGAAGLIGLDVDHNGNLIGKKLPDSKLVNAASLLCVPGMGDKKYVVRNSLLRTVAPMPVFAGEKNFNPHYLIVKLSKRYRFHPVNQCFCLVEYQPDGMTANIWKQYVESPHSFAELRRAIMEVPGLTWRYRIKNIIHYCSSSQIARNRHYIQESPRRLLTALCAPAGWALTGYIRRKAGRKI